MILQFQILLFLTIFHDILLCGYLHIWFDSGCMKINPETKCIEFSDSIMSNESVKEYHQFNNKKIKLNKENIKFLNKKYQIFNQKN